ncbi:cytidine deaminase [Woeseia oceani]|uniref:Cytidine deaminase n=1 Tax=Woeseia oceani TaxID=1548547 RepID=A0A193LJ25_9GAMM|nr:cytidine deaminase [Woeseia oceani]ANO52399.1 cytidine deaminase [Woeseia oceani]
MNDEELIDAASTVRERAYAPHSGYYVGAALLDESGKLHLGCNVENSSFPLGSCAEAGAISAMVAAGGKRIAKIAAVGGRSVLETCTPCGGCRQRIAEFADDDTRILLLDESGDVVSYSINELLPASFHLHE